MTTQTQIDRLITQRASEWVETLKTAGPLEREAFVDWLRESRRHVAEYLTMAALERELDGVDLSGVVDRQALLARLTPPIAQLRPAQSRSLPAQARVPLRWKRLSFAAAAAITATGIGLSVFLLNKPSGDQILVAAAGEQRAVELSDGSVVQLNGGSQVTAHLTRDTRELELVKGEALFKVARDSQRPFRVRSGNAVIEALGTQFNINALGDGIRVSVVEGKVQISVHSADTGQPAPPPVAFGAGEAVLIDSAGIVRRNPGADVTAAIAWRQKRLVFQQTALEEVVHQFNSHNAAPKLKLEGIESGTRHYSASFDVDDPESFADYLAREPDLLIERRAGEILIRAR